MITKIIVIYVMVSGKQQANISEVQEAIEPWVRLADDLGVPRSLGQLYGFLFLSESAQSAQECAEQLMISRSSAGQGLRMLKELGAIKSTFILGERSERFVIEPDLGVLLRRVLEGRLAPAFSRFFRSTKIQLGESKNKFHQERLQKINRWEVKLVDSLQTIKGALD